MVPRAEAASLKEIRGHCVGRNGSRNAEKPTAEILIEEKRYAKRAEISPGAKLYRIEVEDQALVFSFSPLHSAWNFAYCSLFKMLLASFM